jgi:hypothetical protein
MSATNAVNEKISITVWDAVDGAITPIVGKEVYHKVWDEVYATIRQPVIHAIKDALDEGLWDETMGDTR